VKTINRGKEVFSRSSLTIDVAIYIQVFI